MFDGGSQYNLIFESLVDELGLETHDIVQPCSFCCIQVKFVMRITERCKISFVINVDHVDEVECEVAPLDACEMMLAAPAYGKGMWLSIGER